MGSLVFLFLLGFITMFILMGGPVFKVVKTTISSDKLTDKQKMLLALKLKQEQRKR